MDLADFLLARIAEDEARAPVTFGPCDCGTVRHGLRCAVRFLAECQIKRRVVEVARQPIEWGGDWQFAMATTLRLLAVSYDWHPDYRPEWAPTVAV